jgi:hypothetical protein
MLVAVNVTVVTVPISVLGALYVTPVLEDALSVPAPPPMLQLTPEFDPSLLTVSVNACVPPTPRPTVAGLIGFRLIGVSVTVTEADFVGSFTLVAVTTAVAAVTGFAAV